jgi:tetratricopeptide (TPR) repeat protein
MAYGHSYLGLAFLDLQKLELSRKHFYAARRLSRRISFRFGEALSMLNLAQLAIRRQRPTQAVRLARKGLAEINRAGGAIEIARAHRILGEAYLANGDLNKALKHAIASTIKFREVGVPYERALSLTVLSRVQIELKDLQAARQNKARADELFSRIGSTSHGKRNVNF